MSKSETITRSELLDVLTAVRESWAINSHVHMFCTDLIRAFGGGDGDDQSTVKPEPAVELS
jgi:hypothetical protein